MPKFITSVLVWALFVSLAAPVMAISVDITFDAGAMPTDFGFSPAGNVNPTGNVSGGVWDNNLAGGQASYWNGAAGGAIGTIIGPVFHGWAEITVNSWSPFRDDQTLLSLGNATTGGVVFFRNGAMELFSPPSGTVTVPVANQDGLQHTYGWEHDRANQRIKMFFDGVQIGDPNGYAANTANNNGDFYFGDGTGGDPHQDIWNRVVMAEGTYPIVPEPMSIVLIGIAAIGLVGLKYSRR